jgi:hypothetical protein
MTNPNRSALCSRLVYFLIIIHCAAIKLILSLYLGRVTSVSDGPI